jgi:hypothetical protein
MKVRRDDASLALPPRTPTASLPAARRRSPGVATAATISYFAAALLAVPAFLDDNGAYLSLTALAISLAFVLEDVSRMRLEGITAMTTYSVSAIAVAIGNAIAISAAGTPRETIYFLYMAEEHIPLAMRLALAGCIVPVIAFRFTLGATDRSMLMRLLPKLRFRINDRTFVRWALVIGGGALVVRIAIDLSPLGVVGGVIQFAPHFLAFALARAGWDRRIPGAVPAALALALAEACRALLFEYLRADVVSPLAAFALGSLSGSRSLKPLRSPTFVPLYVAAAAFVMYFAAFGQTRTMAPTGLERLTELREQQEFLIEQRVSTQQTFLSRLGTVNQLTQVVRVVQEDGLLNGSTLDYLGVAFIPRAVWPEKPTIAKGAWFALRIGKANVTPSGAISNSINMTIPGELYLNFGWIGVFVGLLLFGAIIAVLWSRTDFWRDSRNVLGSGYGYYLLWIWLGFSLGADLQIIVTLIAMYVVFAAIGFFVRPRGDEASR